MDEFIRILKLIPSEGWTVIGTLLGSLLTIIGVILTNKSSNERLKIQLEHEKNIRRKELRRERAEELYVESKKYFTALQTHYVLCERVMDGKLTISQMQDLVIQNKLDYEHHRLNMIVDMYFPNLQESFKDIMEKRDALSKIFSAYKEEYKNNKDHGTGLLPTFNPLIGKLISAVTDFEKLVATLKFE